MSEEDYLVASKNAVHAIIYDENNNYLFQLRDDKRNIFYPLHWGFLEVGLKVMKQNKITWEEINEELSISSEEKNYLVLQNLLLTYHLKN